MGKISDKETFDLQEKYIYYISMFCVTNTTSVKKMSLIENLQICTLFAS